MKFLMSVISRGILAVIWRLFVGCEVVNRCFLANALAVELKCQSAGAGAAGVPEILAAATTPLSMLEIGSCLA